MQEKNCGSVTKGHQAAWLCELLHAKHFKHLHCFVKWPCDQDLSAFHLAIRWIISSSYLMQLDNSLLPTCTIATPRLGCGSNAATVLRPAVRRLGETHLARSGHRCSPTQGCGKHQVVTCDKRIIQYTGITYWGIDGGYSDTPFGSTAFKVMNERLRCSSYSMIGQIGKSQGARSCSAHLSGDWSLRGSAMPRRVGAGC